MKNGGFEMIERGDDFNLIWTGYTTVLDILPLNKYQRINHFPNSIALGRKDLFWNQLLSFKKKYPVAFNVTPHSWLLPYDYKDFENVRKMTLTADKFFILKPTASSCGRGIRVVHGSQRLTNREETIVSLYVDRPLLINGKKFDMRMYVLVTSFHPLRAYLYQEGLARFATENYSNDANVLKNKFVHLTNFSINKRNTKNYVKNESRRPRTSTAADSDGQRENPEEEDSSKWSLKHLNEYLDKRLNVKNSNKHGRRPFLNLYEHCHDVIIKTLISAEVPIVNELNKVGNR